jgi:predicted nuclease with TOPRIM domain
MKINIDGKEIECTIDRFIERTFNRKLRYRLERLNSGFENSRGDIIGFKKEFEKDVKEMKENIEQFRKELYNLQEVCIIINKVNEKFNQLDEIYARLEHLEEEFIMFKLRLLKEGKNGELDNNTDNSSNISDA